MSTAFQVPGTNPAAPFSLKLHRGDGMALIAMNWKNDTPPDNFIGFAIEYREPGAGGNTFYALKNRITFPSATPPATPDQLSTRISPIQKFRWVHFPRNAELPGPFTYRVTPVFMDAADQLSYGEPQEASIELRRETYPDQLNVTFTRGFVSSQAFVDKYGADCIPELLPHKADRGLDFTPTYPKAQQALAWMGFEARNAILEVLDQAIADSKAEVRVVAYDLNEPEIVSRLEKLGARLKIIIDDEGAHGKPNSAESHAAARLAASAGQANVKRQHMGNLQHNKFIAVNGPKTKAAVCGSTNFSWRGLYVQNNNAIILRGQTPVALFLTAFDDYWAHDDAASFAKTCSAQWNPLGLPGIDAQVSFSPHSKKHALLTSIAEDIAQNTTSTLFFSLAFLYQTPGPMQDAIKQIASLPGRFAYGISDHDVEGLQLLKPNGKITLVSPEELSGNLPQPFKAEPTGGAGTRMHHKFVVLDFDKPTARVYMGSFNFSSAADTQNGENLLLIRDQRIATSYMVEALRIFDHYHFRVAQQEAKHAHRRLELAKPPRNPNETPWWWDSYTDPRKIHDREIFA